VASEPNYFAGSNKVTVVKQHDLEPREFSFGNVPLFGAGGQHFEPNALHAVIDTAADACLPGRTFASGHRPSWAARELARAGCRAAERVAGGQDLRGEPFHAGHRDDAGGDAV